ncbi:MAG: 2-C-methyl-D-erythritol 4-phosphate cytidylyltransferase [Rhodoferax sp.]|nr:2-C-methyl-D-erythritol 4-phosphate cytidylyltransferase [Rhodoferax sp.]
MTATAPDPSPRRWVLLPCAGSGSRAGTERPKQYQVLGGRALVLHTLAAFAAVPGIHRVAVLLAPDDPWFRPLAGRYLDASFLIANCGASTRAGTVFNGLDFLLSQGADPSDWVLVHDAARCLITPALIERLIEACDPDPVGGLLAVPLADTLKQTAAATGAGGPEHRAAVTLDRRDKWLAQTPQMFRIGPLRQALRQAGEAVTDESSAMEAAGFAPRLVPGSARNFKVTWPDDLALAEALLPPSRKEA